jgi:hypothetical protein
MKKIIFIAWISLFSLVSCQKQTKEEKETNVTAAKKFNTVSQIVEKNVVIEEGTGTWCGWCPRGAVAMEYMYDTYPTRFIGVAVHNADPMTVTEYDDGANLSGFPGCNVDRALKDESVSSTLFEGYYNARKDLTIPAAITATASWSGANFTFAVTSTFKTVGTSRLQGSLFCYGRPLLFCTLFERNCRYFL